MTYIIPLVIFGLFLYFGYKDDYQRNKKEFIFTIFGVFAAMIAFALFNYSITLGVVFVIILFVLSGYLKTKSNG